MRVSRVCGKAFFLASLAFLAARSLAAGLTGVSSSVTWAGIGMGVTVTLAFAVERVHERNRLIGDRFGGMNIQREQRSGRYGQQPTHGNPFLVFQTLFYQ